MKAMRLVVFFVSMVSTAWAQDAPESWGQPIPVTGADAALAQAAVTRQLDAFGRADAAAAYAEAAPNVRRRFPTSAAFMAMARSDYRPLFLSNHARFGSIRGAAATPTHAQTWSQTAFVETQDGKTWAATYGLERQPDGSLQITSCVMVPAAAGAV